MPESSIENGLQRIKEMMRRGNAEERSPSGEERQPYLVAGLGNPGREYRGNRHNIGFMAIDTLAAELGVNLSRVQSKAIVGSGALDGSKIVLAKPQTFMNLSGEAIAPLIRFYKVPQQHFLLIHDDLDIPFGTLRLRPGGGAGGQKGVASTINRLGTPDFARLRLGIGRPPGQMDPSAYVLQDFSSREQELLKQVLVRAVDAVRVFLRDGLDIAMNQFNGPVVK